MGVKEYYFTGGEPFLNPEMVPILIDTLDYGPATVLTNGTVLRDAWLRELRKAESRSRFSLEFRVSIDGVSPEQNDPILGKALSIMQGSFPDAPVTRTEAGHFLQEEVAIEIASAITRVYSRLQGKGGFYPDP